MNFVVPYSFSYLPTCLLAYLPTCLLAYLPTCLLAYCLLPSTVFRSQTSHTVSDQAGAESLLQWTPFLRPRSQSKRPLDCSAHPHCWAVAQPRVCKKRWLRSFCRRSNRHPRACCESLPSWVLVRARAGKHGLLPGFFPA